MTAVLVNTCQKYHYILPAFLKMLDRYWENMTFPLYVSSTGNLDEYRSIRNFEPITMDDDPGVLQAKLVGVEQVPEDLIILLQEDFLVERYVDDDSLKKIAELMENDPSIGCVRLMPSPEGRGCISTWKGVKLVEIQKGDMYSFSFQAAMWRKSFLIRVMKDFLRIKEWKPEDRLDQMIEINSKLFMNTYEEKILCVERKGKEPNAVYRCPIPYRPTAIERGILMGWAKELISREGIIYGGTAQ